MVFESAAERRVAAAISHLAYCNPFLPERMRFEAEALGERFIPGDAVWNAAVAEVGDALRPLRPVSRAGVLLRRLR